MTLHITLLFSSKCLQVCAVCLREAVVQSVFGCCFVLTSFKVHFAGSCLQSGTTEKMTSFSMIRKKTPFQKHREEEEAKKKVWG